MRFFLLIFSIFVVTILYMFFKVFSSEDLSVVMVAFGNPSENGRWQGEIAPYIERLKDYRDISYLFPFCEKVFQGRLNDQPILLVVSGIGKVNASSCTQDLLEVKGRKIKELIFAGIGGITPLSGGMVDINDKLRQGNSSMIGDVCINSVAFDFDLQYFSSDQVGSNYKMPVFWPFETNPSSSFVILNDSLVKELSIAANNVSWPNPPIEVENINKKYHKTSRKPMLWNKEKCIESTNDLFWHDILADVRAREMGASYLEKAYGVKTSFEDIVVFTSMEASAVGLTISRWNKTKGTNIDFAYVRAASNFDHPWLASNGLPEVDSKESIEKTEAGYNFAIQIQALPVLKMFELRSKK